MEGFCWLPPLLLLTDYGGNWDEYVEAVYAQFCKDFVEARPVYDGKRLGLKRYPLERGKEVTFWHMTSEGDDESSRTPDLRRCERIGWPRPSIENCTAKGVKVWEEHHKGNEWRVHIWLEEADYLVVLARRRRGQPDEYILPWTAFMISASHQRRKYAKRFQTWSQNS